MQQIGILGNGGQADEAESYLDKENKVAFRAVDAQFLRDKEQKTTLLDILNPGDYSSLPVVIAVGAPAIRKEMHGKWPGSYFCSVVSDSAVVLDSTTIGRGCILSPGAVVTTNVKMGEHVIINISSTVSHDCTLGDYVTVSPGATVAGNASIGSGVFIGAGAVVSSGVKIAAGSVVGAGAVVLEDVVIENSVVVGVPGEVIKINQGWLREI